MGHLILVFLCSTSHHGVNIDMAYWLDRVYATGNSWTNWVRVTGEFVPRIALLYARIRSDTHVAHFHSTLCIQGSCMTLCS